MLKFEEIKGSIFLESGLHIGGNDSIMQIGKVDKEVIKHEHTKEPYIPGSSLKGKIRSLLEQKYGFDKEFDGKPANIEHAKNKTNELINLCKLFGDKSKGEIKKEIGVTRGVFRDSFYSINYKNRIKEEKLSFTEVKTENSVNNLTAEANPRSFERVVSGAEFEFFINIKIMNDNERKALLGLLFEGLDLLEKDYLGGHGSRGSGKIRIELHEDTKKLKEELK
ncbi:type III-A CRISPR-associated RAMP protein Csm3 [Malaciobacter sp. WC5094]